MGNSAFYEVLLYIKGVYVIFILHNMSETQCRPTKLNTSKSIRKIAQNK